MGRRMKRQTSRKSGSPGLGPDLEASPGWGHAPFVKPGPGDPHTPHRRAPAPCQRFPGSRLRLRTKRGQRREGTQSARPGHLFPRAGAALPLFPLLPLPVAATHPAPQLSVRAPCAPWLVPVQGSSERPPLLASGAARPRGEAATTSSSSSSSSSAALAAPPDSALPPRRAHPAHTHSPAPSARPTCDLAPGCPLPPASKKPEAFVSRV